MHVVCLVALLHDFADVWREAYKVGPEERDDEALGDGSQVRS